MERSSEFQTPQARTKSPRFGLTPLLIILLLPLLSCEQEKVLPGYSGATSEIVVVMEQVLWDGAAGESLRELLYAPFPALPQIEESFSLIHQTPQDLRYNLRLHRNLIIADIEDNERNVKARAVRKESQWSKGQVVYTFHALDEETFVSKVQELGPAVAQDIRSMDRQRIQAYYANTSAVLVEKEVKEKMGIELDIHEEYVLHSSSSSFAWMTRERIHYLSGVGHDVIQGVAIYIQPYESDSLFQVEHMISNRDEMLKEHVVSSYDEPMRVERLIPPLYAQTDFRGHYAVEGRGLWRMERPIMGGPWISLSVIDEENGRVITVDGYVFAPKFDKRDYLLDMEAIAYSLDF